MKVLGFSVLAFALLFAVACTSDGDEATPEVSPSAVVPNPSVVPTSTVLATPTGTAVPTTPYRVSFAQGETIDASPAVVFGDIESGEAEAWVFPGADWEFAVSPGGDYVIYHASDETRLLRTASGGARPLETLGFPVEFGPGDVGFLALDADFNVVAFNGEGEPGPALWSNGQSSNLVTAWSADGRSIAIAQARGTGATALAMSVDFDAVPGSDEPLAIETPGGVLDLEWSPDSERLALVTGDAVRVFDRERMLLWTVAGEFSGNPGWSPDGEHLVVNAMPSVVGADGGSVGVSTVSYLLSRDGAELFRVTGAGSCDSDSWLDGSRFTAGRYVATVTGEIGPYTGPIPEIWLSPNELGFDVDRGLRFHRPHIAWRGPGQFLDDGRFVFTMPEIGHGGCGTIVGASEWPPIAVERPPYGELRSGPVVALELLADEPAVTRVIDAVLGVDADRQVQRLLDLTHRYEVLCSEHGELLLACERARLDVDDTFQGVALRFITVFGAGFDEVDARAALSEKVSELSLELAAVWEVDTDLLPGDEFASEGSWYALWLSRRDWRRLDGDARSGVIVLVAPTATRPVVAYEFMSASSDAELAAAQLGWELVYRARPSEPPR